MCARCGAKTEKTKDLSIRRWTREKCGYENNRDLTASINIMFEGLRLHYES